MNGANLLPLNPKGKSLLCFMLLSIAYYMLMAIEKRFSNLLYRNKLQGYPRCEMGLFECEEGLLEYSENRQKGLFEYTGFSSGTEAGIGPFSEIFPVGENFSASLVLFQN